ncbi:MAG TPA: Uma2 family endonuclease, partial [Chloroflexota bacterium]|nr:Uma2 family endonuclease [Chloroflexota bacterium]
RQHAQHHRLGNVVVAPVSVVLDDGTAVQPDLVFIANDRLNIISERGVEGAPTLVVEVLLTSTANRDRGIKMSRYAASGIEHYWIIDPRQRTLEAYHLNSNGYEPVATLDHDASFQPTLFPGLSINLADLWR